MLTFASSTIVTIEVPYEYNGESLTLTNFQYELLDASGTVLIAKTADPDFNAGNTLSTIVIPANKNTASGKRDVRQLNCYLSTSEGEHIVSQVYILKQNDLLLTVLTDSFMTYAESVLIRMKIAEEQHYYDALTDELKCIALESAFAKISRLKFKVGSTTISDITTLTTEAYAALDAKFLVALKKAQIIEANSIVEQSPIRDKIRQGIISETIGESSMFFRNSSDNGGKHSILSDDGYDVLGPYLYRDVKSSQIWTIGRA